ncbi:MAG: hypothetical protein WCQ70_05980 [Lentimicrobiaceae bacterium]
MMNFCIRPDLFFSPGSKRAAWFMLIFLSIAPPVISNAENILKVDSAYCFPSEEVTVSIQVMNDDPLVSFQLDIPLPPYFSYVSNSIILEPSRKADHIITASVISNSVLRIISYSPGNFPYNGNSGVIATFRLISSPVQGDFILEANNAILGNSNSQNILTSAIDGNVRVMWPLTIYATSSADTICRWDSVYLNAIGGGGTGSYSYSWYLDNALVTAEQGLWVNPGVNCEYLVEVSDGIATTSELIQIYCHPTPLVYAGIDQNICSNEPHYLYGSGQSYISLLWTGGDGYFSDPSLLNTIYYPGTNDILNQGINITITVFGEGNCATAQDIKYLGITPAPIVSAGNDTIIHPDSFYYTSSSYASNFISLSWTTNGDGYFSDPHALHTTYYLGISDKEADSVILILEGEGDQQCTSNIDSLIARFSIFAGLPLDQAFCFGIFPNPVMSFNSLSLIINQNGFYSVRIYDIQSREVLNKSFGFLKAGTHEVSFPELINSIHKRDLFFIELTCHSKERNYQTVEKLIFMNF